MMGFIHGVSEAESEFEAAIAFPFQLVGGGLETIESTVASGGLPAVELSDVVMCFSTFSGR